MNKKPICMIGKDEKGIPEESTIGQMIEFLGDNQNNDDKSYVPDSWYDRVGGGSIIVADKIGVYWARNDELCDELWASCKIKLKNNENRL